MTHENKFSAATLSVSDVYSFLDWLNNQQKDYMGGEFLYDVKGHYKRLKQGEMFDYWLSNIHSHSRLIELYR